MIADKLTKYKYSQLDNNWDQKEDFINPHTTQKNNYHFQLHWGPMDPTICFILNVL